MDKKQCLHRHLLCPTQQQVSLLDRFATSSQGGVLCHYFCYRIIWSRNILALSSALLIGGLTLFNRVSGRKVYRKSLVDVVDTMLNYNLLALSVINLYHFKYNTTKQTVVAYTSTIITFTIFIGSILCYHVVLLMKKKSLQIEQIKIEYVWIIVIINLTIELKNQILWHYYRYRL